MISDHVSFMVALEYNGFLQTRVESSCMLILPLLLSSVLSWRFTLPFLAYVHSCVLLLAIERSKINCKHAYVHQHITHHNNPPNPRLSLRLAAKEKMFIRASLV